MRIVGGELKGKKIFNSLDKTTRPLKDLVRESIFNILEHSKNEYVKLKNSKVTLEFSEKHTDDNRHNQQQVLESFEIAIDNTNSLLDFLSFPIRSDRSVRHNQTTNIIR